MGTVDGAEANAWTRALRARTLRTGPAYRPRTQPQILAEGCEGRAAALSGSVDARDRARSERGAAATDLGPGGRAAERAASRGLSRGESCGGFRASAVDRRRSGHRSRDAL